MEIRKSGIVAIALAAICAAAVGLSSGGAWAIIERFVVILVFGGLGLFMAESSRLKGSLVVSANSPTSIVPDILMFGVLLGTILGLINYYFFFGYRYSPFVLPRIRNLGSVYESFLLSLEIGVTEEVIYRLFFLSCILYTAKYLQRRWWPNTGTAFKVTPISVALMASALIFTFAHRSPFSFPAAFLGGLVLGLIFISKGVETAITAHVAADFLFFTVSYIYKS